MRRFKLMRTISTSLFLTILSILVLVSFIINLLVGASNLSMLESMSGLIAGGNEAASIIVREIRLPRAILALCIGFSLGLSGAVLQGFLRNPLAEPGLLGISSMASLGAVVLFYFSIAGSSLYVLPMGALIGALAGIITLLTLSLRSQSVLTIILAGVALSSLSAALTSLVLNLSPNPFASYEIIFWLLGSLKDRSMEHVWIAVPMMLIGWIFIASCQRTIDALSLGEGVAASLGINLSRSRFIIVLGVALCVASGTAVAGSIGFIGLVVPHLLRPFTNGTPSHLLLPSALGGAALLLLADTVCRLIVPAGELNVGVLTALLGAPFFFWLVLHSRQENF